MTSKEIVDKAVRVLDDKKALDIQVLDILKLSSLGDYFIIASGNSTTHVKALVNELEKALLLEGEEPRSVEGLTAANWVLMDYLDVMIHIFDKNTRDYYQLERLWGDAASVNIDDLLTD